jgi:HlyD family secretion protein
MMGMKKRVALVLVGLAVITVTVAAYYRANHASGGPQLVTAVVSRGNVIETVEATGTLEAVTTVQVGTQVSGTIKELRADFNSQVKKGQIIAKLDPSLFQTQVDQARATLVRLQAEVDRAQVQLEDTRVKLNRARELSARQLIPATDLETAESNARAAGSALKAAEAQVTQARASLNQNDVNLGHTIIKAPIDGIVISRNVDVGQTVAASMQAPTLFVIANDLTEMRVNAKVDESDIGRIRAGQQVTFRVDAYPTETFTGSVSQVRLQPVVEQNVVSYVTVIDVPNREMKLKPGMTATVTVEIARADDVLRVPAAATRFRPTAEVFAALGQDLPGPPAQGSADAAGGGGQGAFANMTPEQREQMRQRPGSPPRVSQRGGVERFQQMSPEQREQMRQQRAQRQSGSDGAARPGGPVRIWVLTDGHLAPVRVRVGISDGVNTEISAPDVKEGAQVVTGLAAQTAAASPTTGSPLLPFGGRGFRGGGGQRGGAPAAPAGGRR